MSSHSRTTKPALDVLDIDQDAILYRGDRTTDPDTPPLINGFVSYWELGFWWQAAAIRTLGRVRHVIPAESIGPFTSFSDRLLLAENEPHDQYVRQRVVEHLDDACKLAYKEYQQQTDERLQNDETDHEQQVTHESFNPSEDMQPGMRPAFEKLESSQRGALRRLRQGFRSRQAVSKWVRQLTAPAQGHTPSGLMNDIVGDKELLRALTNPGPGRSALQRYQFACHEVLPAFADAASSLQGSERHQPASSDDGLFQKG